MTAAPKERGMPFTAAMVRQTLAGRKGQTRRVIKPDWWRCLDPEDEGDRAQALTMCPYGVPGDLLYVREGIYRLLRPREHGVYYVADDTRAPCMWRWKRSKLSGRYMPKALARIWLEITGVRVERVRDISDEDILAEGFPIDEFADIDSTHTRCEWFGSLWDEINGKRPRCSWADNPWVWVVSFQRIER